MWPLHAKPGVGPPVRPATAGATSLPKSSHDRGDEGGDEGGAFYRSHGYRVPVASIVEPHLQSSHAARAEVRLTRLDAGHAGRPPSAGLVEAFEAATGTRWHPIHTVMAARGASSLQLSVRAASPRAPMVSGVRLKGEAAEVPRWTAPLVRQRLPQKREMFVNSPRTPWDTPFAGGWTLTPKSPRGRRGHVR
jgi:hypothetical protein